MKKLLLCRLGFHKWEYSPMGLVRYCMRDGCDAKQVRPHGAILWINVALLILVLGFYRAHANTDTLILVIDGKKIVYRQVPKENVPFDTLFTRVYLQGEKKVALK